MLARILLFLSLLPACAAPPIGESIILDTTSVGIRLFDAKDACKQHPIFGRHKCAASSRPVATEKLSPTGDLPLQRTMGEALFTYRFQCKATKPLTAYLLVAQAPNRRVKLEPTLAAAATVSLRLRPSEETLAIEVTDPQGDAIVPDSCAIELVSQHTVPDVEMVRLYVEPQRKTLASLTGSYAAATASDSVTTQAYKSAIHGAMVTLARQYHDVAVSWQDALDSGLEPDEVADRCLTLRNLWSHFGHDGASSLLPPALAFTAESLWAQAHAQCLLPNGATGDGTLYPQFLAPEATAARAALKAAWTDVATSLQTARKFLDDERGRLAVVTHAVNAQIATLLAAVNQALN